MPLMRPKRPVEPATVPHSSTHIPVVDKIRTIMSPLTAFAVSPEGVKFETQETDEEVILFLRQHLIVLLPAVLILIVLLLSPVLILPAFFSTLTLPFEVPAQYIVIGTAFWYVMTFGVALTSFLRWFFNIYIVTQRRIIDIDFLHLLYKEFSETRIDKVQDLSFKSGGIFAAFFNYGDVIVQTAGDTPNIDFTTVPYPAKVVETISELITKEG
jgi:hypothetical protein